MTMQGIYRRFENLMPWVQVIVLDLRTLEETNYKNITEVPPSILGRHVERFRVSPDFKEFIVTLEK